MIADALQTLRDRGFVQQMTDVIALERKLNEKPQTIYTGYDPTGDSLHVGHLVTLMALRHLAAHGHMPMVIFGGGTAHVGDPTGKSEMRPVLTRAQIEANVVAIAAQVKQVLSPGASDQLRVLNNADWLLDLNYIDFLRHVGRHFSVNRMLSFEAAKQRLERGLSFIEFNYQLLQAFDFYVLQQKYDCGMQLGGDDQWGNIVAGVDLCRRMAGVQVEGITVPLMTTASGAKMGKTAAGAVWLDAKKLAPYTFYQYWINSEDADVQRFLKIFTLLPLEEIAAIAQLEGAELNAPKSILAFEATRIVHGYDVAIEVHVAAQGAFGGRLLPQDMLPASAVPRHGTADAQAIPGYNLSATDVANSLSWCDLLVRLQACKSKGEARRLISQGGLRVDDMRVTDPAGTVSQALFTQGSVVVRAGKKRVYRLTCATDAR